MREMNNFDILDTIYKGERTKIVRAKELTQGKNVILKMGRKEKFSEGLQKMLSKEFELASNTWTYLLKEKKQ